MRSKILSLHPWLDDHPVWHAQTCSIADLDPGFHSKSLLGKLKSLLRHQNGFDTLVFYYDQRFALLAGLILSLISYKNLVLLETYPPIVARQFVWSTRNIFKYCAYWLLYRLFTLVIVHSKAEITEFAKFFRLPRSRFAFVPYFVYFDVPHPLTTDEWKARWKKGSVVCAGRHRDVQTFIQAASFIPRKCVIIGGKDELTNVELPGESKNLEIHTEMQYDDYLEAIANAAVIVLPFNTESLIRSLGHITYFEATYRTIPVVSSGSFCLADYATENRDILLFPERDPQALAGQVNALLRDPSLGLTIAQNAQRRAGEEFTRDQYVVKSLERIHELNHKPVAA